MLFDIVVSNNFWLRLAIAMEKQEELKTMNKSLDGYTEAVAACSRFIESSEYLLKDMMQHGVRKEGDSLLESDSDLWLAYIMYGLGRHNEALQHLQAYLDVQVHTKLKDVCRFCGQVKSDDQKMLKCSLCRASRFCNKECQRAASTKRHMAMRRIRTHSFLNPHSLHVAVGLYPGDS